MHAAILALQDEGEEVRLPQLVGAGTLEALGLLAVRLRRRRGSDVAGIFKHTANRGRTRLEALRADPADADTADWSREPLGRLIDHVLARFHTRHREQLPELIRLALRVEQVHAAHPDCPAGLADHLRDMQQELESHMQKEEDVLFPILAMGQGARAGAPITVMRMEHEQHGQALARLDAVTHDATPPAGACTTWRALYAGLRTLREDLMEHIHLENNILFERAAAGEPAHA